VFVFVFVSCRVVSCRFVSCAVVVSCRDGECVRVRAAAVEIEVDGATFLQLDMSSPEALPAIVDAMQQVPLRPSPHC